MCVCILVLITRHALHICLIILRYFVFRFFIFDVQIFSFLVGNDVYITINVYWPLCRLPIIGVTFQ